jgi:hypothetical protein
MPTNRDELFETLVAFKEQDPGRIGTENAIPWGFFNWSHWAPYGANDGDVIRNLMANVPGGNFEPIEVFQNAEGDYPKIMYPPVGLYIMSPSTSDNTDAVVAEREAYYQRYYGE